MLGVMSSFFRLFFLPLLCLCFSLSALAQQELTEAEQKSAKMHKLLSSEVQKEILKERFAHLDICSNERLREIDVTAPMNDIELTRILPDTYRKYMKGYMCKKGSPN